MLMSEGLSDHTRSCPQVEIKDDVLLQSALGSAILDTHRRMCSEHDAAGEGRSRKWLRMIEYVRDIHAGTGRMGELAHDFSRFPRILRGKDGLLDA